MKLKHKIPVMLLAFAVFLLLITLIIIFPIKKQPSDTQSTDTSEDYVPQTMVYDDIISEPVTDNMPSGVSYTKVTSTLITDVENGSRIIENYPVFSGYQGMND